jgi:hypothetical protein
MSPATLAHPYLHLATPSAEPFVATVAHEIVEADVNLAHLLVVLAELLDDQDGEDVVVWHGRRVVLIFRADGSVTDFREAE